VDKTDGDIGDTGDIGDGGTIDTPVVKSIKLFMPVIYKCS
jgi:hypothetical protein